MNARAVWMAPWHGTHRSMRWMAMGILALCVIVAIGAAVLASPQRWPLFAVVIYSVGLGFVWAFFLPSLALLAADAHWLRIPGMQRATAQALLLYGVLSLVPTMLVALFTGGNLAVMTLIPLLCMLGGLGFALLPRYMAMFMGPLPALYQNMARTMNLPGTGDPRFPLWAATAAAVLAIVCVLRWRGVVATSPQRQLGMSGAMVLHYRRAQWSGWGGMNGMDSTQQVRQRPDWLQPQPDLRHVGPQQPTRTLRVALGGWYLPRTLRGHLQAVATTLLATLAPFAAMFLIFSQNHGLSPAFWWPFTVLMIGWICIFGSLGLAFMTVMLMQQRWRKNNAELPLLALLPGLGDAASSKRRTLVTALRRPLVLQALALLVIVALAAVSHPATSTMLMIVVGQLGIVAVLVACLLCIVGGRPLPGWATALLMIVVSLLIGCNSFLPSSMVGSHPWTPGAPFVAAVLGGWAAVGLALAWVARRGWRAWQATPHAFMPNG